jgi:hypothetical protein
VGHKEGKGFVQQNFLLVRTDLYFHVNLLMSLNTRIRLYNSYLILENKDRMLDLAVAPRRQIRLVDVRGHLDDCASSSDTLRNRSSEYMNVRGLNVPRETKLTLSQDGFVANQMGDELNTTGNEIVHKKKF